MRICIKWIKLVEIIKKGYPSPYFSEGISAKLSLKTAVMQDIDNKETPVEEIVDRIAKVSSK